MTDHTQRVELPAHGQARLSNADFNVTTPELAQESLARVNRLGTAAEKEAVRAAVAKFWPDVLKAPFPNSNMNP